MKLDILFGEDCLCTTAEQVIISQVHYCPVLNISKVRVSIRVAELVSAKKRKVTEDNDDRDRGDSSQKSSQ